MRVVFNIIVILVLGFKAFSQPYHYSLRNYKAVDGLPQSQVQAVIEDKNGYLWIGTEGGGLARFDGHTFRVYTTLDGLQSNVVSFLNIDAHDNLWIIHPRGITKFDGSSFRKFEQSVKPENTTRLRRMFELGDTLFFMSAPGYIGKIFSDSVYYWSRPILPAKAGQNPPLINFVREAPGKELIFCIDFSKFYIRRGSESFFIHFNEDFHNIESIFEYQERIWIRTDKGYRSVNLEKRTLDTEDLPIKNRILHYDTAQQAFWTSYGNDFLKERIVDGKIKADTVLRDVEIANIISDSEGNTWFGSNGSGLFKYFVQDFDRCGSYKMTGVMAIHRDSEKATWVGTMTRGVFRIKKGKIDTFYSETEPRKNSVYSITESPDGTVYLAGAYGLGKYDAKKGIIDWETFPIGQHKGAVFSARFTDRGLWLSLPTRGLYYRDSLGTKIYSTDDGMRSNTAMAIHYSKYYDCLFYGDEFGLGSVKDGKISNLKTGIANTSVISIHEYRDSLLLLSTGGEGLVVYNPGSGRSNVITTTDGLASDFIYFTAPDEHDDLWVGTEKGITKIRIDKDLRLVEHLHYDYENGLTGVETNQGAFCFFEGNKIFGLIDGLYQFNDPPKRQSAFPLHLTDVQVFYGETPLDEFASGHDGFFNIPQKLALPPDKNHITFKFNRVDKRARKSLKFKYLLQGFDKTWSKPSSSSEVTYSNLPPGDYTFLAFSTDGNGGWSGTPLRYEFRILMPFYAKTEFIVVMIILTAGLIALVLYLRVRQRVRNVVMLQKIRIKEQETVRKDIARDFHDEMGNQLSRIINYVSLLKMNGSNGNAHNNDLYTKVEESAKYLYSGTRDFIWSIDPGNDELSKLFIHIRDFGEKIFEEKNIKFRAINNVRDPVRLPYGFSREANLIFKEAMTNAFKYSKAENVTFSLKPVHDGFEMCLEDDGIGFNQDVRAESDGGLKNIRERAERINVGLGIESAENKGTKVYIQFAKTKTLQYGLTF
jgi:signal transduction histidine kinase/ligand-binding sensor domain-containing protein